MISAESNVAGPYSRELFSREQELIAPGLQGVALYSGLSFERGNGALLWDVDGHEYVDFMAGICVASLGHAHPRHVEAIAEQAAKISTGSFSSEKRVRYLERLMPLLPGDLNRFQFYTSGAEAVEASIRLAKSYTGRHEIVSFTGGFHGKTLLTMGLSSGAFKRNLGPYPGGLHKLPYDDSYCSPLGVAVADHALACLNFAAKYLAEETAGRVAAFIIEPIQGTAGNVAPSAKFVRGVRELAREHGALFIADEMITGFARTGRMFGSEIFDVVPDIMTVGKGMAGGFPASGVISTDEISRAKPYAEPSGSSSSYGGNPLAAAAAAATLEVIQEEKLMENSARLGEMMLERLKKMQQKYEVIGDVRGNGLLIGVDLVEDKKSNKLLPQDICRRLFNEALRLGLLGMLYKPRVRINPPLVITEDQAHRGLDIFEKTIRTVLYK